MIFLLTLFTFFSFVWLFRYFGWGTVGVLLLLFWDQLLLNCLTWPWTCNLPACNPGCWDYRQICLYADMPSIQSSLPSFSLFVMTLWVSNRFHNHLLLSSPQLKWELSVCQVNMSLDISRKRKMPSLDRPYAIWGGMVLIKDWWLMAKISVGGPIPVQVVAEKASGISQQAALLCALCFLSCLQLPLFTSTSDGQFLGIHSSREVYIGIKLFLSELCLVIMFYNSNRP